jgi:DNA-binding NarL/FixJ family response regulator
MHNKHHEYESTALIGQEILSPRQKETVILICDGLCNREISQKMAISIKTVENQRQIAMDKLKHQGVHNVATLVKWAIVTGVYKL